MTKFAVPPHVLAQMKARGVNRTTAAIPSIPPVQSQSPYAAHHLGWQHWQGHTYPQGIPDYTQGQIQALIYTGNQNTNILAPQMSATSQTPVLPVGPQYEALLTPSSMNKSQDESTLTIHMELQGAAKDAGHNESSPVEDDDEEEDLALLDVPDIPKSYGTSGYNEPKLVAKPVYSVAPEWTSSGFGEVTLSEDPEGRTESDYIRLNTADSSINATRTPMQDMDPIFAIIDLDAPATTSKTRSGSKDSGKSELETPHSYGSGDTRPTSIDDLNDYSENAGGRRSRSITPFRRLDYEDIRQRHYHQSNPRRKRRRDRRGRDRDWRSQAQLQEKKRKRDDAEDQNDPQPILNGPLIKKHQPSTTSTTDLESGNPPTDPNL